MENRVSFYDCDNIESIISEIDGSRLDTFISDAFSLTRSRSASLIEGGYVLVNGAVKKKNYCVKTNDFIEIAMPDVMDYEIKAENIDIEIVYQDSDLLVVNKPQNMVVHPAPGHRSGTLVNALMFHIKDLSSVNGVARPGILHRIDKNTSGLLLVAKNDKAHVSLSEQIKKHSLDRFYEAVVHGTPKEEQGDIDFSIGRSKTDRKMMAVYPKGTIAPGVREAFTSYETLCSSGKYSHLKLKLKTGRTHQIRVHLKAIGHPVVGDDVYASPRLESFGLSGQCLHARALGFTHPTTKERMYFESDLPKHFKDVLKKTMGDSH